MASLSYAPLLVYLNAISKHPPLHFLLLSFTSILFVDITTFPQYPVCQDYLYLKYAEMKVEALGVYFVIEVPHATPWIPIARLWCLLPDSNSSSRACCCYSSKVRQGPLRTALSLRGYAYLTLVYHHFCQLSLLCKQALIFIKEPPLHSAVYWNIKWQELRELCYNVLHMIAGQPKDFLYESPCRLLFMQPWPNAGLLCIKKLLIKHCVGPCRSYSVCATIAETWNWFSCIVKCIGDCTQAVVAISTTPADQ